LHPPKSFAPEANVQPTLTRFWFGNGPPEKLSELPTLLALENTAGVDVVLARRSGSIARHNAALVALTLGFILIKSVHTA
jgi:hypothetical protein